MLGIGGLSSAAGGQGSIDTAQYAAFLASLGGSTGAADSSAGAPLGKAVGLQSPSLYSASPAASDRPSYNPAHHRQQFPKRTGPKPKVISTIGNTEDGLEPKTALNQFVQKIVKRPIQKDDVTFTTTKYGTKFQSVVKLNCMEGQVVNGELQSNSKDAEKSASLMVLSVFKDQVQAFKEQAEAEKTPSGKRKAPAAKLTAAEIREKKLKKEQDKAMGIENPCVTAKMKLNESAAKIARRTLTKGEMEYTTNQCIGGYQSTVKVACFPDEFKDQLWAGEVKTTKQAAEQSAAEICLLTIESEPKLKELMEPPPKKSKGEGKGKDKGKKGKGWGKGKGKIWGKSDDPMAFMLWMMGGGGPWGGPPRKRLTNNWKAFGEVIEWKGSFGWIKPAEDVLAEEDEKGPRWDKEKKIYAHKDDFAEGTESLEVGNIVQFHVYSDSSGFGAEEIEG